MNIPWYWTLFGGSVVALGSLLITFMVLLFIRGTFGNGRPVHLGRWLLPLWLGVTLPVGWVVAHRMGETQPLFLTLASVLYPCAVVALSMVLRSGRRPVSLPRTEPRQKQKPA